MSEDEKKIQDIYKKIEREKNIINAANAMRSQTTNEAVRSRLDTQLRDGRRNLQFFEETLRGIQMRKGMGSMALGGGGGDGDGPPPAPPPKDSSASWRGGPGAYGNANYGQMGQHGDPMAARHQYPGSPPGAAMSKPRPNFTKLGWSPFGCVRERCCAGGRISMLLNCHE